MLTHRTNSHIQLPNSSRMGCASSNDHDSNTVSSGSKLSNMQDSAPTDLDLVNEYFNKKFRRKPRIKKIATIEKIRAFFDVSEVVCNEVEHTLDAVIDTMTKTGRMYDDTNSDDAKDNDLHSFPKVKYYKSSKLFNVMSYLVELLLKYNDSTKQAFVYPNCETYNEEFSKEELHQQQADVDEWTEKKFGQAEFLISRHTEGLAQTTFTHTASIVSNESKNDGGECSQFCGDYLQHP